MLEVAHAPEEVFCKEVRVCPAATPHLPYAKDSTLAAPNKLVFFSQTTHIKLPQRLPQPKNNKKALRAETLSAWYYWSG